MEILAFCMLQWLCGKLPWEDDLLDKDYVGNSKIRYCVINLSLATLMCTSEKILVYFGINIVIQIHKQLILFWYHYFIFKTTFVLINVFNDC
jgi:hypothetical protein